MIVSPQNFIVHQECEKAAWENGYRKSLGEQDGWTSFASTTAQGRIWLAAGSPKGPWLLSLDHPGVIHELSLPSGDMAGPGLACFSFPSLAALYKVLGRVYQLAVSLPDAPLNAFYQKTAKLPKTTEAERLVIQRIGQNIFRESLLDYWQGRCPLTGITDPALLRASHIVPWADCASDAHRLDVHNGLLLSALWDAAFDRALVTFGDDGVPLFHPTLSPPARDALKWSTPIPLGATHRQNLVVHRRRFQSILPAPDSPPPPG